MGSFSLPDNLVGAVKRCASRHSARNDSARYSHHKHATYRQGPRARLPRLYGDTTFPPCR